MSDSAQSDRKPVPKKPGPPGVGTPFAGESSSGDIPIPPEKRPQHDSDATIIDAGPRLDPESKPVDPNATIVDASFRLDPDATIVDASFRLDPDATIAPGASVQTNALRRDQRRPTARPYCRLAICLADVMKFCNCSAKAEWARSTRLETWSWSGRSRSK